jgi:hypothetical protein
MLSNALELLGLLLVASAVGFLFSPAWGVLVLGVECVVLGYALDKPTVNDE